MMIEVITDFRKKNGLYLIQKALNCMYTFWEQLFCYRNDGNYTIDNSLAERSIRPMTVERKNSLFFCSKDFCYLPYHYRNLQATRAVCKRIYQELPERSLFGKNRLAELNSCQDLHLKLIIIKNSPSKCVYLSDRCSKASFSLDTSFLDAYRICGRDNLMKQASKYFIHKFC